MGKINFKTLGAKTPKPAQSITEPRDLFSALPEKDSTLDYLRPTGSGAGRLARATG